MGMICLDLDQAQATFAKNPFWSWNRLNVACVLRRDHLRGGHPDLATAVRDRAEQETGKRPAGRVFLLTQPRYFGFCFNPISVYVCLKPGSDIQIETLLLEVHNTPWGEERIYVLPVTGDGPVWQATFAKTMHVSPFMAMDVMYRLRLDWQTEQLSFALRCEQNESVTLSAVMRLQRSPATSRSLSRLIWAYPLTTLRVVAAIHWEALRLWVKRIPVVPHPKHNAVNSTDLKLDN